MVKYNKNSSSSSNIVLFLMFVMIVWDEKQIIRLRNRLKVYFYFSLLVKCNENYEIILTCCQYLINVFIKKKKKKNLWIFFFSKNNVAEIFVMTMKKNMK